MNEYNDLIQTLLSKGISKKPDQKIDLSLLNKIFIQIGFEAIEFPYRNIIVLKDRLVDGNSDPIWNPERIKEIEMIFESIKNNTDFTINETVELLIKNNYLKIVDKKLKFTERSLIQFSEVIEKYFDKCEFCGFINETDNKNHHEECKNVLNRVISK